jgi:hypothetical protein
MRGDQALDYAASQQRQEKSNSLEGKMNYSRRRFLQTGSTFGLAALVTGGIGSIAFGQQTSRRLGSGIGTPIPKAALKDPLYNITRAMFTQNLKTRFLVSLGGVSITTMTLIEVNDLNPPSAKNPGTTSRDCYSLVFTGPSRLSLGQNTYTFEHSKLGKFQLFIVQGEKKGLETRYGALINRVF